MRILVTNDDGIYSPGLAALAEVAADSAMSGLSRLTSRCRRRACDHAIEAAVLQANADRRIRSVSRERHTRRLRCPRHTQLAEIDVVLSGINLGSNLGNGMWHSGTIAAARQAALLGVRGVAFSAPVTSTEPDFDALKPAVHRVLELLLPRQDLELVNVNLPEQPPADIQWTRQSMRHYEGSVVPGTDPMGREVFGWSHGRWKRPRRELIAGPSNTALCR